METRISNSSVKAKIQSRFSPRGGKEFRLGCKGNREGIGTISELTASKLCLQHKNTDHYRDVLDKTKITLTKKNIYRNMRF